MIENLRAQLKKYTDRLDALSLRERGIVFVAVMVVLYAVAANLLFPPLYAEQDKLKKQLTAKRSQIQLFEVQIQAALAKSALDPDAPNRAKLADLERRLQALDRSLATVTARLVPSKDMARLVEQILARNRRVSVVRIESLPAEPLQSVAVPVAGQKPGTGRALMAYRHGMRIELRGGYLDMLAYLREVENLPWKMFWGQVTLQVEQYPVSRLVLHVYTLSTQESWIGI